MNGTSKQKKTELRVDWADGKAATFACTRWHYSKSVPPGTMNIVGVWEDGAFIGVVLFARGASPKLGAQFGLKQTESCELVRVALRAHKTPVTRIVKFALRLLRQRSPGVKLVVSFADANQGHHGGIYQGGGWIYAGTSLPKTDFVDAQGKKWHTRQVTTSGLVKEFGQLRRCKKRGEMTPVRQLGKHRYLMPLDDAVRARVAKLARPYPKRSAEPLAGASALPDTPECAAGVASTASDQLAGDGKPIAALH